MTNISPLFFSILIPLAGALFIGLGAAAPRRVAGIASFINLLLILFLLVQYALGPAGYKFVSLWPILPAIGLNFILGADGLSLIMLLLSTLVTLAAIWTCPKVGKNENAFFASVLLISAGVVGAFASLDIFFFYAFHELALIPTFLLIGIWGSGDRQAAAWKATIYLGLGSFVLLLGIIGLYWSIDAAHRTFDMRAIPQLVASGAIQQKTWVYLLLLFGFGTLISLFPFHSWAPQAYASAPAPASMLHAGVLKKFGLYGLLRIVVPIFSTTMLGDATFHICHSEFHFNLLNLLLVLLLCNIIYVGFVTIAQEKLDWMLGYSSVMHMGYIFLGIAGLTVLSLTGAAILMFAHGLSIAVLFALTGQLRERTGTLEMSKLGGLARQLPILGVLFGFGTMASIGLPGFANFAGEILVFFGTFGRDKSFTHLSNYQITTILALWGVVISAVYMLRAYRHVFMGSPGKVELSQGADLDFGARIGVVLLLAALMIVGFYPQILIHYVAPCLQYLR